MSGSPLLLLHEIAISLDLRPNDVDLQASFVELGGHSLSAAVLSSVCKKKGIDVSVASILTEPSIQSLLQPKQPVFHSRPDSPPSSISDKASNDGEPVTNPDSVTFPSPIDALDIWPKQEPCSGMDSPIMSPISASMSDPDWMTEMQLSMLQGSLNDPRTNFIYYCETYPQDMVSLMKDAWTQVIFSEPIFQIIEYYTGKDGTGNYTTLRDHCLPQPNINWKEIEVQDRAEYIKHRHDSECLFDTHLESKPNHLNLECQFRVITWRGVGRGGRNESSIVWRVHHSLIDGFSASLVFRQLRKAKQGIKVTPGPSFGAIAAELRLFQATNQAAGNEYWERHQSSLLSGTKDLLLPSPGLADTMGTQKRCSEVSIKMHSSPAALSVAAKELGVTQAAIIYTAWAMVLCKYTDCEETVVGAVLSGRNLNLSHVDEVVGPLINTLPFYIKIDRASSNRELLKRTFYQLVELATYQWTTPANGFTRDFSSALAVQFEMPMARQDDGDLLEEPFCNIETDIPLSITVEEQGIIRIVYQVSRYFHSDIERLARCLCNAIEALLRPDSLVQYGLDSLLSCEDLSLLQTYGNCRSGLTTHASVKDDLVTLFERTAISTPDSIAVEKGTSFITYGELNLLAGRIASELRITPQQVVCIHSDRSINWIIGMWAILKAGGVYCSLDPALPEDLRDQIYTSAGAKLFLSPSTTALAARPRSAVDTFNIEQFLANGGNTEPHPNRVQPKAWALAYLCFTSGSTGKPKGVMCTHEGLVAFQRDLEVRLFAQPGKKVSQFMSVAFDGSIHEIFSTLCYGATLVLANGDDPFAQLREVDSAILTPSIAAVLDPADFPKLSTVYLVGERVTQAVADRWGAAKALYNMYGPTEGTGGATIKRLLPGLPVTIGKPNPSSRIYILDSRKGRVNPGVIGEIYLAGVQIARGYLGRPTETQAVFLQDNTWPSLGEQMYRTGDRGYWNSDGEIVFLGRNDRQIKMRGFRIDLEDIEVRMKAAFGPVSAAAVANKDTTLVALVRPATVDVGDFRKAIARVLPVHAVPQHIFAVDEFPVTKVGKLDYAAIAAYKHQRTRSQSSGLSPSPNLRGSTERRVAVAWRNVLGLPDVEDENKTEKMRIDANSSFIALGGHSLAQLRLANMLTSIFGCKVPVRVVAECDTLRILSSTIDELMGLDKGSPIASVPDRCLGEHELSPIEMEWWQKYDLDASSSAFNVSMAGTFAPGAIDRNRLIASWNTVLATHRILRCRYVCAKKKVTRVYAANPPQVERVHAIDIWAEINRPFQLTQGPPVRVFVTDTQMVVTMSHIVCDLTTFNILLAQVTSLYKGEAAPEVKQTYMDSTSWHRLAPPCYLDHWDTVLRETCNEPSRPSLKARTSYSGKSLMFSINLVTWHRIQHYCTARNITHQQLAIAAVALALSATQSNIDITIGAPYINRNSEAECSTVGLFLEPLPVRIKFPITESSSDSSSNTSISYLSAVQKASRDALAFAIPWHQLLSHLQVVPDFPNHSLFETMVTFHEEDASVAAAAESLGIEPCMLWTEGAKFQLMCEFAALSPNRLLLRVEHDTDCFSHEEVLKIENCISLALEGLVGEMGIEDLMGGLRLCVAGQGSAERLETDLFGKEVKLLR